MNHFLLLQSAATAVATAPPTPVGEWLAMIVGGLTIITGAFKVGTLTQRVNGFERDVVKKLEEFIATTNDARQMWAGWRATTDARLSRVEQDQVSEKESRHDFRNTVTEQYADHERRLGSLEGERRNGPADRRQS